MTDFDRYVVILVDRRTGEPRTYGPPYEGPDAADRAHIRAEYEGRDPYVAALVVGLH